nr:IspD/TarI family cytidylyltransferase [Brevibacterium luteolum]
MGAGIPKAFAELAGTTLLEHCVRGAHASGVADHIVVAVPEAFLASARDTLGTAAEVVAGGADRVASVRAALVAAQRSDPGIEAVLVHDAARCLTPPEVFTRVTDALGAGAQAVVPVLPVTDTIKRVETLRSPCAAAGDERVIGDIDREQLRRVQTPQGFAVEVLEEAHALQARDPITATDDAMLAERLGHDVRAVAGDERALKITHPLDMRIAELLLEDATAGGQNR